MLRRLAFLLAIITVLFSVFTLYAQDTNSLLTQAFQSVEGVESVGMVSVIGSDPTIVYGEIRVQAGSVNSKTAAALQQTAFELLATASLEFTVILDDGKTAADFTWDNQTDTWRETSIVSAGPLEPSAEATPEAPTNLTLPPAMEALVGVWDTEAPSGDDTVPAQMIFFPNVAVFKLSEVDKKNSIATGQYEIVDETHLDAIILGLGAVGGLMGIGGVEAQIEIVALTDDAATLTITLHSAKSETTLVLTRASDQEDNSAQLVGFWKSANTESTLEFRDDNTINLPIGSQTDSSTSRGILTYFLHGDQLEFLTVLELKTTIAGSEVTITTFDSTIGENASFTEEGAIEFHDPQTDEVTSTLEKVDD